MQPPHRFGLLSAREYAYLLGIYLGDGTILRHQRVRPDRRRAPEQRRNSISVARRDSVALLDEIVGPKR